MFAVSGVMGAQLEVLEPAVPLGGPSMSDACRRIGAACSEVYSRWFLAMRRPIERERGRQAALKLQMGLPKAAKVESMPLRPLPQEVQEADTCEAVARAMFGDMAADYARERFRHAMGTGDMRAFKIRLLLLKARDSLQAEGSPMAGEFAEFLEEFISDCERKAGCVPCPGPRRLSRAEQEKRRLRMARQQEEKGAAPADDSNATAAAGPRQSGQKPDHGDSEGPIAKKTDADTCSAQTQCGHLIDTNQASSNPSIQNVKLEYFDSKSSDLKLENELLKETDVLSLISEDSGSTEKTPCVTVTRDVEYVENITAKNDSAGAPKEPAPAIEFHTPDDILEAMRRGRISPGKALLLMAQQDASASAKPKPKPKPKKSKMRDDLASLADEIEAKEFGDEEDYPQDREECEDADEREDEDEDGGELVDDGYRYDSKAGVGGTAYNTGRYRYSSCYGGYNASGSEWCPDDDF